jgi:hypothetical protein
MGLAGMVPSAGAENAVAPAYDPCEYAHLLIANPNTYDVGGIVGVPWLEAAVCQETQEECALLGKLCPSGVAYDELDELCAAGKELRICVPKDSADDNEGICVAITNGCPSLADSCEEAHCVFEKWTPIPTPAGIGTGDRPQFIGAEYDRPVACELVPKEDAGPACENRDPNFTTPPPPPTEHPCDEYEWNSKEWWCCVDANSPQCKSGSGDYVAETCESKYPDDPQGLMCCRNPQLPQCIVGATGGTGTGGSTTGGSGTGGDTGGTGGETGGTTGGGTGCCNCCDGCDHDDPEEPENPTPDAPEPSESAGSDFSCTVTALDAEKADGKFISVNKDGTGISLIIDHSAPAGLADAASVTLAQTAGPDVTMNGSAEVPFASQTSWTVQLGRPDDLVGEYIPNAAFLVTVYGADGQVLHQTTCEEQAGLHSQGGSSGCALTASFGTNVVSNILLAATALFLLMVKRRGEKIPVPRRFRLRHGGHGR